MHYTIISAWSKICNAANYILSLAVHFRQLRWIVFMLIGNCILEFTWTEPFETSVYSFLTNQINQTLTSNWLRITAKRCESGLKLSHSYFDIRVRFILQDLYLRSDRTHYKNENVLSDFSAEVSRNEHAVLNAAVSLRQTDESASNKHTSIRPYCTSLLISAYVICACNLRFREDGYSRLSSSKTMSLPESNESSASLKRMTTVTFMKAQWEEFCFVIILVFFGWQPFETSCNVNAYLLTGRSVLLIGRTFRDGEKRTGGVWFDLPSRWTLKLMLQFV